MPKLPPNASLLTSAATNLYRSVAEKWCQGQFEKPRQPPARRRRNFLSELVPGTIILLFQRNPKNGVRDNIKGSAPLAGAAISVRKLSLTPLFGRGQRPLRGNDRSGPRTVSHSPIKIRMPITFTRIGLRMQHTHSGSAGFKRISTPPPFFRPGRTFLRFENSVFLPSRYSLEHGQVGSAAEVLRHEFSLFVVRAEDIFPRIADNELVSSLSEVLGAS